MFALPPLPRNLEASFRDLASERPQTRVSAIADVRGHAQAEPTLRARAIPFLEARLEDPQAVVRAAAVVALADLEAKGAVPKLLYAVDDDDAYVRQMAMTAVGELADARALPRLRRALGDERASMRYQAVIAFCRVSEDPAEIDNVLLKATSDGDEAVAHIALRVAEERLDAGTEADPRLIGRAKAIVASCGSGSRSGSEVASAHVALVAAIFLGKTGELSETGLLLRVVRGERIANQLPDKEDERAAVELVGELGLLEAKPHLERRAWGAMHYVKDTCAFHAKVALARMGHPRAVFEILKDLDSGRPDVVAAAVVAAGRARLGEARTAIERISPVAVDPTLVRAALERLRADVT